MANSIPQLFDDQDADGNSDVLHWEGGDGWLVCGGTFSAATVALQYSPDEGATWLATGTSRNSVGMSSFSLPPGDIRLNQSSTAGDSTDAWIGKVHPGRGF